MGSPHNTFKVDSHSKFLNSTNFVGTLTLEDIEEPSWINTTIFSESCGSCLSRISSLCLDGIENGSPESSEGRSVPDQFDKSEEVSPHRFVRPRSQNSSAKLGNVFHESGPPMAGSESLQSLSSSSKTVFASPRSNSEDEFYHSQSKSAVKRCGTLYRERAPSENALDFNNLKSIRETKLSHSLHDVSSIPSNGLKNPSRRSVNVGSSLSALCMRNRSRDSGFIHSESLQSLSSAGRNYDHVESKVKQYIQSIKDADAVRRKERAKSRSMVSSGRKQESSFSESQDGLEMSDLVQKMQYDMEEKDRLLLKLQEDYNNLLGKYAEAENKIDRLRFGWHENNLSTLQNNTLELRTHPPNSTMFKQLKQPSTLPEIDDSSLSSSMFLSNFEGAESPNSSFQLEQESLLPINHKSYKKKEVIVSAPLRPISSLYCTSVRLNRFVPPLNSKSPVETLSSSSRGRSPASNNSKAQKQALDITVREGTNDTGIDSFCQDEMSATPLLVQSEPIGHLPHENSILKVQRWQKSLHTPSRSEFSTCGKETIHANSNSVVSTQQKSVLQTSGTKVFSSIGIQANLGDRAAFPSISSRMSTPMVPCLNLGELSGCTEEFSDSLLSSEYGKKKTSSQVRNGPTKGFTFSSSSSNLETSCTAKQTCGGKCNVCGCGMKVERRVVYDMEQRGKKISPGEQCQSSLLVKKDRAKKTLSQLSGLELAELLSLILKDQDHVVPRSPEEEKSNQQAFKTLERKIKSLKSSVSLQTFVSLLDVLLDKVPSEECSCHYNRSVPGQSVSMGPSPLPGKTESSDCAGMDGSLLQCLEELDEYTNQVWAKTESFLEVLNSNKSGLTFNSE